jgi:hypothetical protein
MSLSVFGDASVTGQSLYSEYARAFRRTLLSREECGNSHEHAKVYLKKVFREIDDDGDGNVTVEELRKYVNSVNISDEMFDNGDASKCNKDKFVDILIQQIDINHDGAISYDEMSEFLWPSVESHREIGIVIEIVRQAIKDFLGEDFVQKAVKWGTAAEEVTLISEYARKTGVKLLRGNLLEIRQLRKSLACIRNVELVALSDYEVSMLIHTIDANNDSVMSPKEFKTWLLSNSQSYALTPNDPESSANPPLLTVSRRPSRTGVDYDSLTGRRLNTPSPTPELGDSAAPEGNQAFLVVKAPSKVFAIPPPAESRGRHPYRSRPSQPPVTVTAGPAPTYVPSASKSTSGSSGLNTAPSAPTGSMRRSLSNSSAGSSASPASSSVRKSNQQVRLGQQLNEHYFEHYYESNFY